MVDVQEKLVSKILDHAALVRNLRFLLDAAQLLHMPAQATEQYPRRPRRHGAGPDRLLSAAAREDCVQQLRLPGGRRSVSADGADEDRRHRHRNACVRAAHDARSVGVEFPLLPSRGRGQRRDYRLDHDTALRRLEQAGAILTTTEGCLFEWLGGSSHPQFKAVSELVQERMKQLSC